MSGANEDGSITWHYEYNIDQPPERADKPTVVRFIVLSDTHSTEPDVPNGDVLLHSGDLTDIGGTEAFQRHFEWLGSLPHKQKYVIAGNHDFGLCTRDNWYARVGRQLHKKFGFPEANTTAIRNALDCWQNDTKHIHRYVEDQRVEFEAGGHLWTLYGSPWTPEFGGWAWNHKRGEEAQALYSNMPRVDILMTHGPPHGHLDVITDGLTHVGCEELSRKMDLAEVRPLLHCCGHIHEARGVHYKRWSQKSLDRHTESLVVNSAIVEFDVDHFLGAGALHYKIKNKPVIVDIDTELLRSAHVNS